MSGTRSVRRSTPAAVAPSGPGGTDPRPLAPETAGPTDGAGRSEDI